MKIRGKVVLGSILSRKPCNFLNEIIHNIFGESCCGIHFFKVSVGDLLVKLVMTYCKGPPNPLSRFPRGAIKILESCCGIHFFKVLVQNHYPPSRHGRPITHEFGTKIDKKTPFFVIFYAFFDLFSQ